jgi:formylglycine-generating enzyme required for sulfatase activity
MELCRINDSISSLPINWAKIVLAGIALIAASSARAGTIELNAAPDKDQLIQAISTPSPPKSVWEHLELVLSYGRPPVFDETVKILQDYFRSLPPPNDKELSDFRAKIRGGLVFVKGGSYLMGDFGPDYAKEKLPYSANEGAAPAHEVTLDNYSIMKHRVTYADYDLYTRANHLPPVSIKNNLQLEFRFPDYPAGHISWQQSQDFCSWLGKIVGTPVSLPTEAQWEYAARSRGELWVIPSTTVKVADGKYDLQQLDETISRMEANGTSPEPAISRPVGTYGENALGVSDVFGRGREWTADWFDKNYYSRSPEGPAHGTLRSVRYATDSRVRLVIDRIGVAPGDDSSADLGFRCVINQPALLRK